MAWNHPWHPDWRGRRRYWEDVNWARTPERDVAVGLYRYKTDKGWENRWYLLFRRLGEDQVYLIPVLSQTFLTGATPGSNETTTLDGTWNNTSNSVEVVASGGSGSSSQRFVNATTGGGGGEYGKTTNFTNPGGLVTYRIGLGGAAVQGAVGGTTNTAGIAGGDSWWNGTTQAGATLGAIGGGAGSVGALPQNGGTAGTGGVGSTHNAGGRGGNATTNNTISTGGGGAGGPNGAGNNGVDASTVNTATAGGSGDAGSGGSAGAGTTTTPGGPGIAGTELGDSIHGCGGAGGGCRAAANSAIVAGSGGNYGAGGGSAGNTGAAGGGSTRATSGAGANGIIVLTWTPGASFTWLLMEGDAFPLGFFRRDIVGY